MQDENELTVALKIYMMRGLTGLLQLSLIKQFGAQTLASLNTEQLRDACYELASSVKLARITDHLDAVKAADEKTLNRYLHVCQAQHIECTVFDDALYAPLLKQVASPPICLFSVGRREYLSHAQLAIVGSRHATANGAQDAFDFAAQLGENGFVITSGMALGIDGQAHSGALSVGAGTVAVLGTGVDVIYPKRHQKLYEKIAAQGLIVSEYLPGSQPRRAFFPQRNRIIAGLSLGTLVVEAGLKSGSLITARMAADCGREVFAMPGSVHNSVSKGCHQLLRQGAVLVEQVSDIYAEIGQYFTENRLNLLQNETKSGAQNLNGVAKQVYDLIDYAPTALDKLIGLSDISVDKLMPVLLELELSGLIKESAGNYQRLR